MNKTIKILRIILLILMLAFLISFAFILKYSWSIYLIIATLLAIFILYFTINYLRNKNISYICNNCNHQFKISLFQSITSLNASKNSKVLICPNCHIKDIMKEKEI